jgi:hypothetical protein
VIEIEKNEVRQCKGCLGEGQDCGCWLPWGGPEWLRFGLLSVLAVLVAAAFGAGLSIVQEWLQKALS